MNRLSRAFYARDNFERGTIVKRIAILGDSYSTYEGFIPADYISWYAPSGNALDNDVSSVEETWWKILCQEMDMEMVCNCSYSGSAVCYTGYPEMDGMGTSFVRRMRREFRRLAEDGIIPDYIFLFGGTNDFWNQSPVGDIKYGNQSEVDLNKFAPAFCNVAEHLLTAFPQSTLIVVINDDITSPVREIMLEISTHYGISVIELQGIHKQSGHPSKLGMEQIAKQIQEQI